MATRVGLAKIWMTPFDRPTPKPQFDAKFSYLSQMRAELLWFLCGNFKNFVTMATWDGMTHISLTRLNRQTPKTPYLAQESWWYLIHKLSYSRFSDKIYQFCCHGNKGGSSETLNDFVWSANPQNPSLMQNSGTYLKCELSYGNFCVKISKFSFPWQQGLVWHKFRLHS